MHRLLLQNLLKAYQPSTEPEIYAKINMQDFVTANPNCFDRKLPSGHITASGFLLSRDLRQALLIHHAKLDVWCQLGGHCDGDPDVLGVAIKESQEEAGIENIVPLRTEIFDLDIHYIPPIGNEASHYHYDVRFILKIASDEQPVQNHESKAMRWFGLQDQLPTSNESVLRMFRKWMLLTT